MKCFICDVSCAATEKYLGDSVARILTMPLTAVLAKCLRVVANIDSKYFCTKCTNKIEEYDQLVRRSRQIETDLYELFRSKSMKCEFEEAVIIMDRDKINEVLIQTTEEIKRERLPGDINFVTTRKQKELKDDKMNAAKVKKSHQVRTPKQKTEVEKMDLKIRKNDLRPITKKPHYKTEIVSCDICGKTYKSKGALGVHLVQHGARSPHGKILSF